MGVLVDCEALTFKNPQSQIVGQVTPFRNENAIVGGNSDSQIMDAARRGKRRKLQATTGASGCALWGTPSLDHPRPLGRLRVRELRQITSRRGRRWCPAFKSGHYPGGNFLSFLGVIFYVQK